MNFDELCAIEVSFVRASYAVRKVATHELITDLLLAEGILQEVRHAGSTLCDPAVSDTLRQQATKRLLVSLFGEHHAQL